MGADTNFLGLKDKQIDSNDKQTTRIMIENNLSRSTIKEQYQVNEL